MGREGEGREGRGKGRIFIFVRGCGGMKSVDVKTFDGLNVSSKFAICGLPVRVDTYKTCSFGCRYCFAENRKIMEYEKNLQVANIDKIKKKMYKIHVCKEYDSENFLDMLLKGEYTWHCGGMSDPFQPVEQKYNITRDLIEVSKEYEQSILFSTKSDRIYNCKPDQGLHTFQLSVTNTKDRADIEPNVPPFKSRLKFYRDLKDDGFRVGIRIQPFIPGVSGEDIIDAFPDADQFTIEGIKIVPQNEECKKFVYEELGIPKEDFTQMGLLNLKPEIREKLYEPLIDKLKSMGAKYSIADNDMHYIGNNMCCCGDNLVSRYTSFNNTAMMQTFGTNYSVIMQEVFLMFSGCSRCKCNQLFTSNRQEGCVTTVDFFEKRGDRASSPFSPKFQYINKKS